MPLTFNEFGIRFLYPDNWTTVDRSEEGTVEGVTLELPTGGFVMLERDNSGTEPDQLIEQLASAVASEYHEVEREKLVLDDAGEDDRAEELSFYYLDLLVISRIILLHTAAGRLVIQIQAESRDFDANEMVFAAILKQLRDAS